MIVFFGVYNLKDAVKKILKNSGKDLKNSAKDLENSAKDLENSGKDLEDLVKDFGVPYKISRIIRHPLMDNITLMNRKDGLEEPLIVYDFALLQLEKEINFMQYPKIRPVCLPQTSSENYAAWEATVTGLGFVR